MGAAAGAALSFHEWRGAGGGCVEPLLSGLPLLLREGALRADGPAGLGGLSCGAASVCHRCPRATAYAAQLALRAVVLSGARAVVAPGEAEVAEKVAVAGEDRVVADPRAAAAGECRRQGWAGRSRGSGRTAGVVGHRVRARLAACVDHLGARRGGHLGGGLGCRRARRRQAQCAPSPAAAVVASAFLVGAPPCVPLATVDRADRR